MYPFSSFALLTTDIDHEHLMILELKRSFGDTDGSCSALNNVLFRWMVGLPKQAVQIGEKVGQAVDNDKYARYNVMKKMRAYFSGKAASFPRL